MLVTREDDTRDGAVCQSTLSNGYWVSTVLLDNPLTMVVDRIIGNFLADEGRADLSTPGAYETMVFLCDGEGNIISWTEQDFARYDTREDAEKGHEEMVEKWMARK